MWPWLKRWIGQGRRQRPDLRFILYTRAGCHLCEVAMDLLTRLRHNYGFSLETRDVDADPALKSRYDQCVPVVEVNGKERYRGRINEVLLQRIIDAPNDS